MIINNLLDEIREYRGILVIACKMWTIDFHAFSLDVMLGRTAQGVRYPEAWACSRAFAKSFIPLINSLLTHIDNKQAFKFVI